MCGFVGYYNFKSKSDLNWNETIARMADEIQSRGPDSCGYWKDADVDFVLGHRRLSIVDLSELGHQPMISQSGRFVLSYNGEIYNTEELRQELVKYGVQFKGHSDTEVLLEACAHWGVEATLPKLNGMFAFALWDRHDKRLFLARDRLGIKPLYWGFQNNTLFFGSQIKAFKPHPGWQPKINRAALTEFFRFNYIPAPLSIYEGIQELKPGYFVAMTSSEQITETCYWRIDDYVNTVDTKSDITLVDIECLIQDAVKRRMVADVPLGGFLSGGVDSSLVVALMQSQSMNPIKTFSIGFHEDEYNEAVYAKQVAHHLGTDHHELYLSMQQAADLVPKIQTWYGEPFADSSQIPTFLVSQLARQHVIVSLSGDGGDELFSGYNRYILMNKINKSLQRIPMPMRRMAANLIQSVPGFCWNGLSRLSSRIPNQLAHKAVKLAAMLKARPEDIYYQLVCQRHEPQKLVLESHSNFKWPDVRQVTNVITRMQLLDSLTYLPDDILTKVDRASMACSLEARVPLLDHRVVEMAFSLPLSQKLVAGKTKWPLRQILYKHVPSTLIERPKMGFGVPIGDWLRHGLRDWAEELLDSSRIEDEGYLNSHMVQNCWQQHLSGKANWQYRLWCVLMFQDWLRHESKSL